MTRTTKMVALVVRGPAWRDDLPLREQSEIEGHLAFMVDLVRRGVLEEAGPFATIDERLELEHVGLVMFANSDLETAERVLEADPARAAGTVDYEVMPWYR